MGYLFAFGVILSVSRTIKSKEELQNERMIRNEFNKSHKFILSGGGNRRAHLSGYRYC